MNACSTGHFLDHHPQQVSKALPWHRRQTSAQNADPPVGGRPSDLRVPAHHATGETGKQKAEGKPNINAKRVLRIMQANQLTLEQHTPGRTHDGIVIAPRSNVPRAPITSSLLQRRDRPRIVRHGRLRSGDHRLVGYDRGHLRRDGSRHDGRLCRASVRDQQRAACRRMVVR
jgi:hypothetical protein